MMLPNSATTCSGNELRWAKQVGAICSVQLARPRPNKFKDPLPSVGRPPRAAIYHRLDEAVTELRERLGGLPSPAEAEDIWSDIWHQEAHNSTAIEGNTLVLQEVEKLLEEGRAVGAKPLADYMEVKGYGDAAKWVYGQALEPGEWTNEELISLQEIRQVHYTAMTPVWTIPPTPMRSTPSHPATSVATR